MELDRSRDGFLRKNMKESNTQVEDELRELTRGPDSDWLKDPSLGRRPEPHTAG